MKLIKSINNEFWNAFLEHEKDHQLITIAHNPCLGPILSKSFGYFSENYLIVDKQEEIGVLPLVSIRKSIVSMPHFSYGGPIVDSKIKNNINFRGLIENRSFEIRSFSKFSPFYNSEKITCLLELKDNSVEQWQEFKSKLRNLIKKSEKFNLISKHGKLELLSDFYSIYSRNMLRLGSPPLGKNFFKHLLTDYVYGVVDITVVYFEDIPVATGFTLSYLGFEEVCWASTNPRYNKYNVNMFLYWDLIKTSIKNKNKYFSFGRTTVGSNTHKFKKQWGSIDIPIYFNFSEKRIKSIKKFTILAKLWKFQPLKTSIFLGKIISKFVY